MRQRYLLAVPAIALICSGCPRLALADIYTWTDATGRVNVSNLDPPEGVRVTSVIHVNPPKITPATDAQRDALRDEEVQALAERVRQLQDEVEMARRQPPPARVEYRVPPMPPPAVPYGGDWGAPVPSYAYAPPEPVSNGCDPAWAGCPFGFAPIYSTLVVVRAPPFHHRPGFGFGHGPPRHGGAQMRPVPGGPIGAVPGGPTVRGPGRPRMH